MQSCQATRNGLKVWRGACLLAWLWFCLFPLCALADETQKKIQLFGTIEFKGALKTLPAWLSVLERNAKNNIFFPGSTLEGKAKWDELKNKWSGLTPKEQISSVNLFWNKWPYREDMAVYKKPDYWAIPKEFAVNSGDCEDYSIAKYFTLRALGFEPDQLRVVVLKDTIRNLAHAVLVVYLDGDAFVLDNLSNMVLPHTRYKNYLPQLSVNEETRWVHVRPK